MSKRVRDLQSQSLRNEASGRPENYLMPWTVEDLVLVANHAPTKHNRELLANALHRTESSIDYVWYQLYLSRKHWRKFYPNEFPDTVKNLLKARKIAGITRVFTPEV